MKTEIYSGITFKPANLSNETECFFNFPFSSDVRKTSEKNKMDNSQNGYSSVGKTGKIKKQD